MRRLVSILTISVFVFVSARAETHLAALAPKFDFGIVPTSSLLSHQFWLKSTGTDTVKITEIKTGCSCVVSDLHTEDIPPGDSLLLRFTWDTKRTRGSVYRSPRIFYDSLADPVILEMSAVTYDYPDSARPVSAKPYRFEFGRTSRADIDSIGFVLTNWSDQELSVTLISAPGDSVMIELPPTIPANGSVSGYARLNPAYRDREFDVSATLAFDDNHSTHLTIPIRRKFY